MKFGITCILVAGFAVVQMTPTDAAMAEDLPVRKPGQWRLSTVSDTTGLKTFETCLTEKDSIVSDDKECSKPDVKRINDEIFVNTACKSGSESRKISTLLTGDYSTWYRAVTKISFDPPQGAIAHIGVIVDGKYLGSTCSPAPNDTEKKK
jgi:hypothetical protein